MEVNIKKELQILDRNDFDQVNDLVDRIVDNIWTTSKLESNTKWQDELKMALVKDYMFDLINPYLLDFNE